MDRRELVLALLAAADGRPYTPVQLQKAVFLVTRNMPHIVQGPGFQFAPYDYGPFDSDVYNEALALRLADQAAIAPSPVGRWNTYSATESGVKNGRAVLEALPAPAQKYLREVSAWVRSQSFSSLVKSIYDTYPEMRANSIFRG
jgi:uncharacterized protein